MVRVAHCYYINATQSTRKPGARGFPNLPLRSKRVADAKPTATTYDGNVGPSKGHFSRENEPHGAYFLVSPAFNVTSFAPMRAVQVSVRLPACRDTP